MGHAWERPGLSRDMYAFHFFTYSFAMSVLGVPNLFLLIKFLPKFEPRR